MQNSVKHMTRALVVASLLAVSACVTGPVLAPAGSYVPAKSVNVTLGRDWSDVSSTYWASRFVKGSRVLTIDGIGLNELVVAGPIASGSSFLRIMPSDKSTTKVPVYQKGASSTELVEFIVDSVTVLGYQKVESVDIAPVKFDGQDGLRVRLTGATSGGLIVTGLAQLAETDKGLHVLLFLAPGEHYFGTSEAEVVGIFDSVKLK